MVTATLPAIITTILAMVTDLATEIFTVGGQLVTFITSNAICLIPLAAWLVVLAIGAVRRLVKGA